MELTYYGHSCFLVVVKGKRLLFDPFISGNELANNVNAEDIEADYIFLSHGHDDHVGDALAIAQRTGAKLVSNYEVVTWFEKKGVKNNHPMNHGGSWQFDFGRVKYVGAVHSSMMPDGSYGGNPGGFVVMSDEGNFYFAGDTALTVDMQLIPRTSKLDFALLPIGDNFTMGVDDAIVAAEFIDCSRIIGIHYDTFGYIKIDHDEAVRKFTEESLELILMNIGEKRLFFAE